jgi:hypothetical protein
MCTRRLDQSFTLPLLLLLMLLMLLSTPQLVRPFP